ncbi:unnamed protein product [Darwinula stevensoni]|uniref:Uncharacterized protein n=1 Tax=Darwinula stevensoni TaxID=69355 RepID=A0A7R9A417_9CRUS|nr:unnamed protein product [Darwinula stevensoni]CAG0883331.1 unnamed protein product [Darwinula stevensoni]
MGFSSAVLGWAFRRLLSGNRVSVFDDAHFCTMKFEFGLLVLAFLLLLVRGKPTGVHSAARRGRREDLVPAESAQWGYGYNLPNYYNQPYGWNSGGYGYDQGGYDSDSDDDY